MIPEGAQLWGRLALVTSAPFTHDDDGEAVPARFGPKIGDEVVTVGREPESENVGVVDRHADGWALHPDCLTLISRFDRPEAAPITPDVAAHVLWHYRQIGYPPGSFTSALIRTIAGADSGNRRLLARGFPDYVRAVELATEDLSGIDLLRRVLETRKPL